MINPSNLEILKTIDKLLETKHLERVDLSTILEEFPKTKSFVRYRLLYELDKPTQKIGVLDYSPENPRGFKIRYNDPSLANDRAVYSWLVERMKEGVK